MKIIIRSFCLWLILLFSGLVLGNDLSVKTLSIEVSNKERGISPVFSLPFVESKSSKIAARINDFIFINELGILTPAKRNDYKLKQDDYAGTVEMSYQVLNNNGRVLSIGFEKEGCGAYCETYGADYNFDTDSGRAIGISDLFTPEGWEVFNRKQLLVERQSQIKEAILELKKNSDKNEVNSAENIMVEQFQDCITLIADPQYTSKTFTINNKVVTFTRERCSNHAFRALDNIGDFANAYPVESLRPYLSSYGKALLLNEGTGTAAKSPFNQVLHGFIGGKIAITLLLLGNAYEDQSFSAVYFYDKHRQSIPLSGTQQGNSLTLKETDDKGKTVATIKLAIDGESVKGEWLGNNKLSFEAAP